MKDLFKNSIFVRYFFSCTLAYIGISIGLIGLSWYIIDVTGSNSILANYSIIMVVTTIIASFFMGILVDKYNNSMLMKGCCFFQGLLLFTIFMIFNSSDYKILMIYCIAIINSLAASLYNTASRSILNFILTKDFLVHGNSVLETSTQVGAILAAGITGVLYDFFGINIIIYIMCGSLVISSLVLKFTKHNLVISQDEIKTQINIDKKKIFLLGIITFVPFIITLLSNSVLPGYVNFHLKASSTIYGTADMLYGIGALISGIFIFKIKSLLNTRIEIKLFIISFFTLLYLFFNTNIYGLLLAYIFFGLSNTSLKIFMNTIFMKSIPKNIYGKCYSIMNSISSVIQVIILMMLGKTLDIYGAAIGFLILSFMMLVDGILFYMMNYNFYFKHN